SVSAPHVSIPDQLNAASAFLDSNIEAGRGSKTAIFSEGKAHTYAQIASQANQIGNGLRDFGIDIEQRVAMILLDSPAFATTFFGAIKIGAVPVPINTLLRPADFVYMLNDSRARVLVIHAALWPTVRETLPQLDYVRNVVVVGLEEHTAAAPKRGILGRRAGGSRGQTMATASGVATIHDFDHWREAASSQLTAAKTSKDDSAFWLYSSGSTGFPKGCVHLQHDMTYCTEYYAKPILKMTESDSAFSSSKLFFAYGLGNGLYFPFGVGASAVHHPGRPVPEELFNIVQQARPTLFFAVPTVYASMLALPDAEKRFDFSSVRTCVSAGEALPADILRRWQDRFHVDILDGIGSTEILHIFISNRPGDIRPGSTGRLVPGYQARIVDGQGQPTPTGELGTLQISGDSTTAYYWNKHEKTKEVIQGEWISTGDTYSQDEDGYFWYGGRADDMLRVGGRWVSPAEVEGAIIAHPAVLEVALIGASDQDGLIRPKAYVVLQPGNEASDTLAADITEFTKSQIAPYKAPQWIEFIAELPKTATGKIQRFMLRQAESGGGRAG
ncbi:MAG TPA: benzoate-CoA ligase family protein, partial [Ktedonobacterales bacterium]